MKEMGGKKGDGRHLFLVSATGGHQKIHTSSCLLLFPSKMQRKKQQRNYETLTKKKKRWWVWVEGGEWAAHACFASCNNLLVLIGGNDGKLWAGAHRLYLHAIPIRARFWRAITTVMVSQYSRICWRI